MDLRKALRQKRRERVGVGVADEQELFAAGRRRHDAQRLVPAEKIGVLILLRQTVGDVQAALDRLSGEVGNDGNAVGGHIGINAVRGDPPRAGR